MTIPKLATQTTISRITLAAPDASEVIVAGSFNEWSTTTHAMTRDRLGWWEIELDLPPGRYEYKFVVDGAWYFETSCDCLYNGCDGCIPTDFCTMSRMLEKNSEDYWSASARTCQSNLCTTRYSVPSLWIAEISDKLSTIDHRCNGPNHVN